MSTPEAESFLDGMQPPASTQAPVIESVRETERSMLDRLRVRFSRKLRNGDWVGRRYVIAEKVPLEPGAWSGTRIADAIVLDTHSTAWSRLTEHEREVDRSGDQSTWGKRQSIHGFEVKVSRADWLTELKDPSKAEAWAQHCHYFWLVAASRDIVRDDLPQGWGLMVPHGVTLRVVTPAVRRDPTPMPMPTLVALARAIGRTEAQIAAETRITPRGYSPTDQTPAPTKESQ